MDRIIAKRVVSVVTLADAEDALPLARALLAGGLDVMEITLRTDAALDGIRRIRTEVPGMCIGAGTILSPAQVDQATEAGAQFGVAPGLSKDVVRHAARRGMPFVPGVMTPSEVERALLLGCKLLKFFPSEPAGGAAMLKALAGPYLHTGVRFIPLGGVNPSNAVQYLGLKAVAAIGGSWLTESALVESRDWETVTTRVREVLALAAPRAN
jgi:2-dehydro-3-deoxyphosphogluconate aldolase/(4S)-4-hydroxy-2-oxoglutarate aldolase